MTIADLLGAPVDYEGKAVRTRGRFDVVSKSRQDYVLYTDSFSLALAPEDEVAGVVRLQSERWEGKDLEVTGVFRRRSAPSAKRADCAKMHCARNSCAWRPSASS